MKAALVLALVCPLFTPTKSNGPPTARWLGDDGALPRNGHLFVAERWTTAAPPKTNFTLFGGTKELELDDRVTDFVGRERLHEIVPRKDLGLGAYRLKWLADGATERWFSFTIGDVRDEAPPTLDVTRAEPVDNPPEPKCDLFQAWRSASIGSAVDDVTKQPIYLVWRAGEDGLVDLSLPPSHAVSGAGKTVDLGPTREEWIGVAAIDAAGHRTPPLDLPIGTPRDDPRYRPARLWVKGASTWIVDNPLIAGGVLFGILVVVSFGFSRSDPKLPKKR